MVDRWHTRSITRTSSLERSWPRTSSSNPETRSLSRDRSTKDFWAFGGKSLGIVGVFVLVCAGDVSVASAQNPRGRGPFTDLFGIGPESTITPQSTTPQQMT